MKQFKLAWCPSTWSLWSWELQSGWWSDQLRCMVKSGFCLHHQLGARYSIVLIGYATAEYRSCLWIALPGDFVSSPRFLMSSCFSVLLCKLWLCNVHIRIGSWQGCGYAHHFCALDSHGIMFICAHMEFGCGRVDASRAECRLELFSFGILCTLGGAKLSSHRITSTAGQLQQQSYILRSWIWNWWSYATTISTENSQMLILTLL